MNPLDKAIENLRRLGMTKELLEDEDGRVCSFGALNLALTGDAQRNGGSKDLDCLTAYGKCTKHLTDAIKQLFPERVENTARFHPVVAFNDHPETDQEDVELVFKHASFELEAQKMKELLDEN